MAIKIIRKATPLFTMECERCECVFTYSVHDLVKYLSVEYVRCPCCGEDIPHYQRQRDIAEPPKGEKHEQQR